MYENGKMRSVKYFRNGGKGDKGEWCRGDDFNYDIL
jgi:hypothetical protein